MEVALEQTETSYEMKVVQRGALVVDPLPGSSQAAEFSELMQMNEASLRMLYCSEHARHRLEVQNRELRLLLLESQVPADRDIDCAMSNNPSIYARDLYLQLDRSYVKQSEANVRCLNLQSSVRHLIEKEKYSSVEIRMLELEIERLNTEIAIVHKSYGDPSRAKLLKVHGMRTYDEVERPTTDAVDKLSEQLAMTEEELLVERSSRQQHQQVASFQKQVHTEQTRQLSQRLKETQFKVLRLEAAKNHWTQKSQSIAKELRYRLSLLIPVQARLEQALSRIDEVS
jgi:hypothetical protein